MSKFTKKDLKSGHVIETRNGKFFMFFDVGNAFTQQPVFIGLSETTNYMSYNRFTSDLSDYNSNEYDIVRVYEVGNLSNSGKTFRDTLQHIFSCIPPNTTKFNTNIPVYDTDSELNIVYKRTPPKELTISEISELLGYEVKIVKEHGKVEEEEV